MHIPFCRSKCGYCDFFSVPVDELNTSNLIEVMTRELKMRVGRDRINVHTVYWGGGTPTILPSAQLSRLSGAVATALAGHAPSEFTVEANPGTVDDEKSALLARAGVNRVSMGAQSFIAGELAVLERQHSPDDIAPAVEVVRRSGIERVNLDLISGIPGQTLDTWRESLDRAIELNVDHLSCYGLTYEPGTRLTSQRAAGVVTPCGEQLEADMYLLAIDTLAEAGYRQYEISAFARPGCRCEHNLHYWRNEPYLGIGPSAAGCVDGRRYKNVADLDRYVRMIDSGEMPEAESEILDQRTTMLEMIMMQLRLTEGLSLATFRRRTGADAVAMFGPVLETLVERSLINISDTHIALTRKGLLVADAVIAELATTCDVQEKDEV